MSTFADRLKELRQEKKLTQSDLADRLNIGRSAIAMYERGQRIPRFKIINEIADFFNVSTDYLSGKTSSRHGSILTPEQQKEWFENIKEESAKEGHPVPDSIHNLSELTSYIEEAKLESIIKSQRDTINSLAAMNQELKKKQILAEHDSDLTASDEREIESDLEDMMNSVSSAAYEDGTDIEDIEAFKATIKAAMIQAKKIAKKKYTPKKYRKD